MIRVLGIFVLLTFGQLVFGQESEEKLIRKAFENYKTAILTDKGEEAVELVDSRTIRYYSRILELVKTADSTEVDTLSILDKLMVFSIRHRTPKEEILNFDGKTLLIYGIKSGMVGKNSVENNTIGEITIENDFAKGQFWVLEQKTPFYFHFYRENGQWKIDLTSLFPLSALAFKETVKGSELDENEFLFSLLTMVSGKEPGNEIWEPVKE